MRMVVRPCGGAFDGALNLVLGGAVDGTGRIIQNEDGRIGEKGTRQGNPLALAARQGDATFADDGCIAVRKAHDEFVGLRRLGCRFDFGRAWRRVCRRQCSRRWSG